MRKSVEFMVILTLLIGSIANVSGYGLSGKYLSEDNSYYSFDKFEGNLFIVDATASWCTGCEIQLTYLKTLKRSAPEIMILSLSVDTINDDIKKMQKLKSDNEATWEFGIDIDKNFQNQYEVTGLPSIFLFDETGNLIKKWGKITTASEIAKAIEEYKGGETTIVLAANEETSDNGGILGELFGNPMFQFFAIFTIGVIIYFKLTGNKEIGVPEQQKVMRSEK
ncbi:MAG: hypothetical protein D6732_05310 [Methanobacteriota archaeon]|nr:MAG: hypothetical protein D6732_05310 [Euryarchaeota archaeon]